MPAELEGFDEFKRDTAKIEREFPNAMKNAALNFARDWVSYAQGAVTTSQAEIAAKSLMVTQSGDGADIGTDSPLFFGSEFGGQARPETMHFPPYNGSRGYWFYPARRANQEQLDKYWDEGVALAMNPWERNG